MSLQTRGLLPSQRHSKPPFMLMQNRAKSCLAGTEGGVASRPTLLWVRSDVFNCPQESDGSFI